jgi:hypothetical protein
VPEHVPADTQDERTMPVHQGGEGRLIAPHLKVLQKVLIGALLCIGQSSKPANPVNYPGERSFGHDINSASD